MSKNPFIQTYSGERFTPFDPDPATVNIIDIAHSLSNMCRYGGHCKVFYSVAQHCTHVASLLYERYNDTRLAYIGLLHDQTEGYILDICRPIKKMLPDYMELEAKLNYALYEVFGVAKDEVDATHDKVKWADNVALVTEASQLLLHPPIDNWTAHYPVEPDKRDILPLMPEQAKELFVLRFAQLRGH